jgi:hypothetical protein
LAFLKLVLRWLVAGTVVYGIYAFADYEGYIQHGVETTITAQQNWIVGETKECWSPVLDKEIAGKIGKEDGNVTSSINCDDGTLHKMKVNIYGRLNQPEHKLIYWRCTRKSDIYSAGFTCRETGAE